MFQSRHPPRAMLPPRAQCPAYACRACDRRPGCRSKMLCARVGFTIAEALRRRKFGKYEVVGQFEFPQLCSSTKNPIAVFLSDSEGALRPEGEPKDPENISFVHTASRRSTHAFRILTLFVGSDRAKPGRSSVEFPVAAWQRKHSRDPSTLPRSCCAVTRCRSGRQG